MNIFRKCKTEISFSFLHETKPLLQFLMPLFYIWSTPVQHQKHISSPGFINLNLQRFLNEDFWDIFFSFLRKWFSRFQRQTDGKLSENLGVVTHFWPQVQAFLVHFSHPNFRDVFIKCFLIEDIKNQLQTAGLIPHRSVLWSDVRMHLLVSSVSGLWMLRYAALN